MTVLSFGAVLLVACLALLVLGVLAALLWLVWKLFKGVFWMLGRVLGFARNELVDGLRAAGACVTGAAMIPLAAMNFVLLRLGAARHYARAIGDELLSVAAGVWRVTLGNPLRFVGLGALVDGVERRLPDVVERVPRGARRSAWPGARRTRPATFDGYDVIGTLPSGGSGAQLFVARPKAATQKRFLRAGRSLPGEVVIKSFALEAGSTLPQIVRESRALEAASALGLVCEHQLTDDHFYYVMPYVKGDDLERVIRALHARGTSEGLADPELRLALGYSIDVLDELQRFHSGGLWHKDVKPANVIVANGRAHLVDFGLVTPLASAMTLTTHGTEYYRDPEMVRLALQGVKVHEVDGVRFDLYSAGAVLYSLIENSFPAHGSLSRLTKRAPEALRWIVQRAMAEMSTRYPSAREMRADLAALAAAKDPFALRPADLPSFRAAAAESASAPAPAPSAPAAAPGPLPFEPGPPRPSFEPAPAAPSFEPAPRKRRIPALACAAAGVFGLFMLAGSVLFAFGHRHARHVQRLVSSAPAAETKRWSSLSTREHELVDLARGVAEDLRGDEPPVPAPAEPVPARPEPAEPTANSEPAPELPALASDAASAAPSTLENAAPAAPARARRVLVLDDVTTPVDGRVLALLAAKLVERGYLVVGREADEDDAAAAVELIAGARNAAGLGHADEPATQTALQRFLDEHHELDALVLVSHAEKENEHLYRVFVRGGGEAGAARSQ